MAWETRTYRATYSDGSTFKEFQKSGNNDHERDCGAKREVKDAIERGESSGRELSVIRVDVPAVMELTTPLGTVWPKSPR